MNKVIPLLAFSILLLVPAGAQNAFALTTVTFDDDGTFTTPSIVESGLTVIGSNTLNILNFNGLGVVGGSADGAIDAIGNEFVTFDFNGIATNVVYFAASAGQTAACVTCITFGEAQIEAFDSGGISLGTQNIDGGGSKDVSALFGNVPLTSFTLTMLDADTTTINNISFDLAPIENEIVGGEIISIEATSLILAGAQTPAVWMLSALSVLGIAAFWITRNPYNVRNIKVILQDYLDRL